MRVKLASEIKAALEATGLPWEIVEGTKHHKVTLAGRQVCVLSKGGKARANSHHHHDKKNINNIQRIAMEIKRAA